jgi:16S rRNA (adenine1518-N6/adenine1519-N6)-dimethyltransferase
MPDFSSIPALDAAALLRRYGLKPQKGLGQNFLQDPASLQSIVLEAGLGRDDTVLEIGPGLGSLTRYLASAARRVVAVELDQRLLPPLTEVLTPYTNVEVVLGDILKLSPAALINHDNFVVVANIPYYITSALMRHLLDDAPKQGGTSRPSRMVLTVQKEVAERICAAPGDLSLLALGVQIYGQPRITGVIPARAFFPAPKVDSACLRVDMYAAPLVAPALLDGFFRLARAGFSQKRKTLRNSLAGGLHLPPAEAESLLRNAGIEPQRRAETVSIEEWGRLAESMKGE